MENKETIFLQDSQIQKLLANFLSFNFANDNTETFGGQHLDEDTTAAFAEGKLNVRQTEPVIKHLVGCSFCRHVTAELVKLDSAFAETESPLAAAFEKDEPSKVSDVLSGLLSRIFASSDDAVFAYQEEEKQPESAETTKDE